VLSRTSRNNNFRPTGEHVKQHTKDRPESVISCQPDWDPGCANGPYKPDVLPGATAPQPNTVRPSHRGAEGVDFREGHPYS